MTDGLVESPRASVSITASPEDGPGDVQHLAVVEGNQFGRRVRVRCVRAGLLQALPAGQLFSQSGSRLAEFVDQGVSDGRVADDGGVRADRAAEVAVHSSRPAVALLLAMRLLEVGESFVGEVAELLRGGVGLPGRSQLDLVLPWIQFAGEHIGDELARVVK